MSILSWFCETVAAAGTAFIAIMPLHAHASYVPQGNQPGQMLVVGADGKMAAADASNLYNLTGVNIVGPLPNSLIDGFPQLYNQSGVVQAIYHPRLFVTQVTSDTSGNFSIDDTIVGFTATPIVVLTAVSTGTGSQSAFIPVLTGATATSIVGKVLTPNTIAIGGIAMVAATSAVKVNVTASGW